MKQTEKPIISFLKRLGVTALLNPSDPPDFTTTDGIAVETTSISTDHWLKGLVGMIPRIKTSKGHWIRMEVWPPEYFYPGDSYENRRELQSYFLSEIKLFLESDVKTGDTFSEDRFGNKITVDVLGRKKGRHCLAYFQAVTVFPYLLPRVKARIKEKSQKIKRHEYSKWWLVLTMNDGYGHDFPIQ